jgi:hypothetical protein
MDVNFRFSRIEIENFRGLKDLALDFPDNGPARRRLLSGCGSRRPTIKPCPPCARWAVQNQFAALS